MIPHWHDDRIVFIIAVIGCASTKDVRNVLRGRLDFVLLMAVVAVVPFLAVTRVLVISSFVQLTAVVSDVNSEVAPSQQWEVPTCAQPMAVVVDVLWKAATSQPNLLRNSV